MLALSGVISSMMQTLVAPILPRFPHLLHTTASGSAWIITATLLAASAATPVAGRLGDLYGKRRVLLGLLGLMVLGSVVAGCAQDLGIMIVGRALQGTAIGTVPVAISITRDELPPSRQRGAVSLISASLGFGAAIGLPAATSVADSFGFRVLFFATALLGVVAITLVARFIPATSARTGGSFDAAGALLLAAGLIGVLLAVAQGRTWGWASRPTVACLILGVLILVAFAVWELSRAEPLLDLRVAASRTVMLTNLSSIALGFALVASSVAFPQALEVPHASGGAGMTALVASIGVMPLGVVMVLLTPLAATIIGRHGARIALTCGALIVAIGYLLPAVSRANAAAIIIGAAIVGIGIGLGYAAMPTLIMSAVPATQTGAANGTNTLMRALGTTIGSAVIGTILSAGAPGRISARASAGPSISAFQTVFVLAAAAAILSAAIAIFTTHDRADAERFR
ncbi:MFS transporter [Amycolatopsis sp. NBC_01480]|uniref:MFS transporter n=1 Tax=Amycolatopsis sp. NBC_01480 TaxID=2903562 RepID=UPI002E280D2B|nr:MFS transporter [Amycolatopsis sp. NBC_01480]